MAGRWLPIRGLVGDDELAAVEHAAGHDGGTATVEIEGVGGTQRQHQPSHLGERHAGARAAPTVDGDHQHSAVLGHANAGARVPLDAGRIDSLRWRRDLTRACRELVAADGFADLGPARGRRDDAAAAIVGLAHDLRLQLEALADTQVMDPARLGVVDRQHGLARAQLRVTGTPSDLQHLDHLAAVGPQQVLELEHHLAARPSCACWRRSAW